MRFVEQLAPTSSKNVHKWISEGISLGCVSGFRVLRMKCQTLRKKNFLCLFTFLNAGSVMYWIIAEFTQFLNFPARAEQC